MLQQQGGEQCASVNKQSGSWQASLPRYQSDIRGERSECFPVRQHHVGPTTWTNYRPFDELKLCACDIQCSTRPCFGPCDAAEQSICHSGDCLAIVLLSFYLETLSSSSLLLRGPVTSRFGYFYPRRERLGVRFLKQPRGWSFSLFLYEKMFGVQYKRLKRYLLHAGNVCLTSSHGYPIFVSLACCVTVELPGVWGTGVGTFNHGHTCQRAQLCS